MQLRSAIRKVRRRLALPPASPHILIACMPKSASSFLYDALAYLPGLRRATLVPGNAGREQELDPGWLRAQNRWRWVGRQHVRWSQPTAKLMRVHGITPVVLTRNLFDIVASLRDHLRSEDHVDHAAWLTPDHVALPDAELDVVLAELAMPWYVHFYLSWTACEAALWVGYDDVRSDPETTVARVLQRSGYPASAETISTAVAKARNAGTRFNKGVSGRGDTVSAPAREHILRLTRHYPGVDFTPVL
jgi:hypothetical protein